MKRAPPAPQSVDPGKQRYPAVERNRNHAKSGSWGRRVASLGEESLSVTRGGDAAGRAAERGNRHSRRLRGREDAPSHSESPAALIDGSRERGLAEVDAEASEATGSDGAVDDGDDDGISSGQEGEPDPDVEMGGGEVEASTAGAGGGGDSDRGESYASGGDEGGAIDGADESVEGAASSEGTGVLFSNNGTAEIEGNYTSLAQDNTTEALQGNNAELVQGNSTAVPVQGNSTKLAEGIDTTLVDGNGAGVEGYSIEALQANDTAIVQGNSTEAFDGNSTLVTQENSSVLDQGNATTNVKVFQEEDGAVEAQQGESTGEHEGWGWDVASAQKISEGVGEPIEATSTSAVGGVKEIKGENADETGGNVGGEWGWENEAGGVNATAAAGGEVSEVAATSEGSDAPFPTVGTEAMQGNVTALVQSNSTEALQGNSTALGQGNSTSLDQGNSTVLDQGYSAVLAGSNKTLLDESYSTALDLGNSTTLVQGNGTALVEGNSTDLVQGTSAAVDQGYSTEAFEGKQTVLQQGSNTTTVQGTDTALVQGNSTAVVQGNSSAGVDVLKEEDGVAEVQLAEPAGVDKGWAWGKDAESAQQGSTGGDKPAGEQPQADHGESQEGGDMGWDWEGQEGTGGDGTDGGEKLTAVPAGSSGEAPPESGVLHTAGNSTVVDVTSPDSQGVLGAGRGEGVGGGGDGSSGGSSGVDGQGGGAEWGGAKEEQEESLAAGGGEEVVSTSTGSSLGEGAGISPVAGAPIHGNNTTSLTALQEGGGDEAGQGGGQGSGGGGGGWGWGDSNESRDGVGGDNGEGGEGSDRTPPAFRTENATPAQGSGSADPDAPAGGFEEEGEQVKAASYGAPEKGGGNIGWNSGSFGADAGDFSEQDVSKEAPAGPASDRLESSTERQDGAEEQKEEWELQGGAGFGDGGQSTSAQHFGSPGSQTQQDLQAAAPSAEGLVSEENNGAGDGDGKPEDDGSLAPNDRPTSEVATKDQGSERSSSPGDLSPVKNCNSDGECENENMYCDSSSSVCVCKSPWEGTDCKDDPCSSPSCDNCRDKHATDAKWGCTWGAGVCRSIALPLPSDAFGDCPEAAVVPTAEVTPSALWSSAALPVLVVFVCGGLLIGVARCIRKWIGGGSSGPEYTAVNTAQGADSAGGDNWGWEGDSDDIEMPMVPKTSAASGSASPPVSGSGSTAAVAASVVPVAPAAMQGLSLGGSGEARSKAEAKRGRGASGGRRGRGGAGGRGKVADKAILADDDLFAELGIEAKPTFRGTAPARRPSDRHLALQASDAMAGNASWVDDDLDDLLK